MEGTRFEEKASYRKASITPLQRTNGLEGVRMNDGFVKLTLGALPAAASRKWSNREALVFNDRRWTYEAFDAEVDRVGKALIKVGVKHGEHVAIWVTNRPEFLFILF